MLSAFPLAELAASEFGAAELARDPRYHADAIGAEEVRIQAGARGQTVANVVGSASMGQIGNPAPQAVNNTDGWAEWQVLADAGISSVSLATGSSLLRISPSAVGGYAMEATATAAIAFMAVADGTPDSDAFARLALDAGAVSSVLAHTFGTSDLRMSAVCQGSMAVYAGCIANLAISSAAKAQGVFNGLAQADMRVIARSYTSAMAGTDGQADLQLKSAAIGVSAAQATGTAQLTGRGLATGSSYIFMPGTASGFWLVLSLAYSSALANRAAAGRLSVDCRAYGQSVRNSRGTAAIRIDAQAERGTNRLNNMPQAYAAVNRPYENRTTNRPAEQREAVST